MADSTIGPQKAIRPVSLRASLRDEVRRFAPSTKSLGMAFLGRALEQAKLVKRIFHVCLNETLSPAIPPAGGVPGSGRPSLQLSVPAGDSGGGQGPGPASKSSGGRACFLYRTCSNRSCASAP